MSSPTYSERLFYKHMNYLIQEMFNHTHTHTHIYISSPTHRTCSNSWPCNYLILCHPLLLLPSDFPRIGVFSNKSVLHIRWPKYYSFRFSISPFNKYSELIFFRIDWFDLLAVQWTLKSLLQHHSSKASVLWCSNSLWSNSHIHTWLLEKP